METLNRIYIDLFYWIQNNYKRHRFGDYRSWIRGQYALQTVVWWQSIRKLKNKHHSFKIIQSEQLFSSKESFQRVMLRLRCYIHSVDVGDDEYNEWMKQC